MTGLNDLTLTLIVALGLLGTVLLAGLLLTLAVLAMMGWKPNPNTKTN